ncbi:MAG: trypsin-like peptidase domain-containing protein [Planctomycetaceae bacterium]|nr:trypsin-like peptidase domain-containing protein [Planctomycetaceae bacterium]
MTRILQYVFLVMTLLSGPLALAEEAVADLFERVNPAVVGITHEQSGGSGWIVSSDGYIITNGHVVAGSDPERPSKPAKAITVVLHDDRRYKAKVIGFNWDPDVALIKIDVDEKLPHVTWGSSAAMRVGDSVYAIGMPRGLKRTLTQGVVSSTTRIGDDMGFRTATPLIQTDAAINPGNSGGPLFNTKGEVIGMNTYGIPGANNLGFALPSDAIAIAKKHYEKYGKFRRAELASFFISDIYAELRETLDVEGGVLVEHVTKESDAWNAGLRPCDVIVSMNNKPVNASDVLEARWFEWNLRTLEVGSRVTFEIVRQENGKNHTLTVTGTLTEVPPYPQGLNGMAQRGELDASYYSHVLGASFAPISEVSYLAFSLPRRTGAWITNVRQDGLAQAAGLANNAIVIEVAGEPVNTCEDFQRLMKRALLAHAESVPLVFLRGALEIKTAISPDYSLKGQRIAVVVDADRKPYQEEDLFIVHDTLVWQGADVTLAGRSKTEIVSMGHAFKPEALVEELSSETFDAAILCGGEGARSFWDDADLQAALKGVVEKGGVIGAIGVASVAFAGVVAPETDLTTAPSCAEEAGARHKSFSGKKVENDLKAGVVTTTGEDRNVVREFLVEYEKTVRTRKLSQ